MRRLILFPALLWMLNAVGGVAAAQNTATTTVNATPSTVTVGGTVALTATVQPAKSTTRPTGMVTFLDGTTPLSSSAVALTPNSFASATFPQTFGTPDPALTGQTIGYNTAIEGELTGDLNGDGVPDLLIYAYISQVGFSVQTFLSNGKGGYNTGTVQTFNFPASALYPNVTNSLQLIDIDGDGKLDLLSGLQVANGNGDGTFAQPVAVSFLSSGFVTSYIADLNGDGKTDILAVNSIPDPSIGATIQFAVTVSLIKVLGRSRLLEHFPLGRPNQSRESRISWARPL
jgi:FG-GAP-like repeat